MNRSYFHPEIVFDESTERWEGKISSSLFLRDGKKIRKDCVEWKSIKRRLIGREKREEEFKGNYGGKRVIERVDIVNKKLGSVGILKDESNLSEGKSPLVGEWEWISTRADACI